MAVGKKTCPFCAMEVSEGLSACPNCGGRFLGASAVQSGGPRQGGAFGGPPPMSAWAGSAAAPRVNKTPFIVVGVLMALLMIMGLFAAIWFVAQSESPPGSGDSVDYISLGGSASGYLDSGHPRQRYRLDITEPTNVIISISGSFDSYLELSRVGTGAPFMQDDDSGGSLNPRIETLLDPGSYELLVRGFSEYQEGSYTLTVDRANTPPPQIPANNGPPVPEQTRQGRVSVVTGPAPVTQNTDCEVFITPSTTGGSLNCRVRVICGGAIVYGRDEGSTSYGFNNCTVMGGESGGPVVITANDTAVSSVDGDPSILLSTAAGSITVTDGVLPNQWTVTVVFTEGAPNLVPVPPMPPVAATPQPAPVPAPAQVQPSPSTSAPTR